MWLIVFGEGNILERLFYSLKLLTAIGLAALHLYVVGCIFYYGFFQ